MGVLKDPIDGLATMLAANSALQAAFGVASAEEAALRIWKGEAPDVDDDDDAPVRERAPLPRVIVGAGDGRTLTKVSTTGWSFEGALFVMFEFETPDSYRNNHNAAHDWFAEIIEDVISEIATDAAVDTNPDIVEMAETSPPQPGYPPLNQGVDFWWAEWSLTMRGVG